MEDFDFMLTITGRELEPWVKKGGMVPGVRAASLADGEVGVFEYGGRALVRQYCEDSLGNIYLFSVNRSLPELDVRVPAGEKVFCFARLLLPDIKLP